MVGVVVPFDPPRGALGAPDGQPSVVGVEAGARPGAWDVERDQDRDHDESGVRDGNDPVRWEAVREALQRGVATHIEREIVEIESIERWVDRVSDEGLRHGDRDFVRRRLEMRRQRRGY
jgi:hypothetical protein